MADGGGKCVLLVVESLQSARQVLKALARKATASQLANVRWGTPQDAGLALPDAATPSALVIKGGAMWRYSGLFQADTLYQLVAGRAPEQMLTHIEQPQQA
jgi:hypothetical protein